MLTFAMLFWIGTELDAPTWYWCCLWTLMGFRIIKFGFEMFKGGRGL